MRQPKPIDYTLLVILALIWASAFFNIKISTESFGPITIAFLRVFLAQSQFYYYVFIKKLR
jgi:drug/metabolite transporter (DMT)-like permease